MLVLKTKNAFTDIAEYDSFTPNWNTTGLMAGELFPFAPLGSPLEPSNVKPQVIGNPVKEDGKPNYLFDPNGNTAKLNVKIPAQQEFTVIGFVDLQNNTKQRLLISGYYGGANPGVSFAVDEINRVVSFTGVEKDDGTKTTQVLPLPGVSINKPVMLVGRYSAANKVTRFESVTDGVHVEAGLVAGFKAHYRGTGDMIVGGGGINWGNPAAPLPKSALSGYLMFNRILSDDDIVAIRGWVNDNIKTLYPGVAY